MHTVQSDEFTLHVGPAGERREGLAGIWLIYADFLGARLPTSWPKEPEYAGGILAYFEMRWNLQAERGQELSLRQLVPKHSTGFDWERWATRARAVKDPKRTAKLTNVPAEKTGKSKPVSLE